MIYDSHFVQLSSDNGTYCCYNCILSNNDTDYSHYCADRSIHCDCDDYYGDNEMTNNDFAYDNVARDDAIHFHHQNSQWLFQPIVVDVM